MPSDASVEKLTRVIVEWFFCLYGGKDASMIRQNQRALMALLEEDPTLAAVLIGSETSYDEDSFYVLEYASAYPLTYMIDFGCDLSVLKKVYKLFPAALRKVQSIELDSRAHPVYFACKKSPIQKDVVVFLAKAYPDAVRHHVGQVFGPSRLALFEALHRLAPFEVIQTLVDLYPKSASDRLEGKLLLEELIQHGYVDPKILEFAVSKLSQGVDTLTVKGDTCCTQAVRVMQRVLQAVQPQLKELSLVPSYSSPDGFFRLVKVLSTTAYTTNDKSLLLPLEKLELAIPTATAYHHQGTTMRNLLNAILSSLPNLQHVSLVPAKKQLYLRPADQELCSDIVLEDVTSSLQARRQTPPLKSLQLTQVNVSDIGNFATFLACPCLTPRVALYQCTLDQQEWGEETMARSTATNLRPNVEHLELDQCCFASADSLCHMLCDFANCLPHLKTLKIKDPSFFAPGDGSSAVVDITEPILALVATQQLRDLHLVYDRFVVDMSAVCRALLDNNKTLQTLYLKVNLTDDQQGRAQLLELVQNHAGLHELVVYGNGKCFTKKDYCVTNGQFGLIFPAFDDECVSTIEYYLNLNRSGRAQVRGNNISKAQFVGLLDSANQTLDGESMDLFNVTYGLLREAPHIWSGSSSRPPIPEDDTRRVRRRLL